MEYLVFRCKSCSENLVDIHKLKRHIKDTNHTEYSISVERVKEVQDK